MIFDSSSEILFYSYSRFIFDRFAKGHIHDVVSALPNVVKPDAENNNVVLTLSNVVNINVEIHKVGLTLFNVVNFTIEVHNVVSTLI